MKMLNRNITLEKIYWAVLLATSVFSLYSSFGVLGVVLSIALLFSYYRKIAHTMSERIVLMLVLYIPFYTLIRLTLIEIGLGTLSAAFNYLRDFFILFLFSLMCISSRSFYLMKKDSIWILFFINWIIGLLISVLNGYAILGISGLHLAVLPMLLYLIVAYNSRLNIDGDLVIDIFLKIAMICAITGLIYYYQRPEYYKTLFTLAGNEINASDYVRFVSVFFTPNVCGCFFSIALVASLVRMINRKQVLYAIPICIFGLCIILTLSRGAWLFSIVAVLLYLCILKPKIGLAISVPIFILFIYGSITNWQFGVFDSFMGNIVKDRFLSLFDSNNSSSFGRVDNWNEALSLLKRSPFGYGMGVGTTAQVSRGIETAVKVIDGFYMKCFAETGVLGLLYVAGIVMWIVTRFFRVCRTYRTEISYIAFLVGCGFLCQSIGSNTFDFVCTAPFIWILLGLSARQEITGSE